MTCFANASAVSARTAVRPFRQSFANVFVRGQMTTRVITETRPQSKENLRYPSSAMQLKDEEIHIGSPEITAPHQLAPRMRSTRRGIADEGFGPVRPAFIAGSVDRAILQASSTHSMGNRGVSDFSLVNFSAATCRSSWDELKADLLSSECQRNHTSNFRFETKSRTDSRSASLLARSSVL